MDKGSHYKYEPLKLLKGVNKGQAWKNILEHHNFSIWVTKLTVVDLAIYCDRQTWGPEFGLLGTLQ